MGLGLPLSLLALHPFEHPITSLPSVEMSRFVLHQCANENQNAQATPDLASGESQAPGSGEFQKENQAVEKGLPG